MPFLLFLACVDYSFMESKDSNLSEDDQTSPTEGEDSITETESSIQCSGDWAIEMRLICILLVFLEPT